MTDLVHCLEAGRDGYAWNNDPDYALCQGESASMMLNGERIVFDQSHLTGVFESDWEAVAPEARCPQCQWMRNNRPYSRYGRSQGFAAAQNALPRR
jgi:hypothetical protein